MTLLLEGIHENTIATIFCFLSVDKIQLGNIFL